jgi:RNA polymerase sigma-70 factor (ECF subfamily)
MSSDPQRAHTAGASLAVVGHRTWERSDLLRVYDEHGAAVHAVACCAHGAQLADDVTIRVFVHLWRCPTSYDASRCSLRAFLVALASSMPTPLNRQLMHEPCSAVVRALRLLHDEDRQAILVTVFGGCTYREAAAVLGRPHDAVKASVWRGLHDLHAPLARLAAVGPHRTASA